MSHLKALHEKRAALYIFFYYLLLMKLLRDISIFFSVEEKKLVDEVFHNAMDVLSEEDRQLPQVENVLPLLRRGIGIHHGGK
jgi:ATP-dependent RNA helicase DOB1